ncbi:TadE/TadG family type IV pilus assembly protein [Neorhizobium sp. NPDC001467]|uniref:TadE/TadG family type IV pilus assembly protein n=1 Tax=Neorhizobium sp. NPDC001467 TaxID=3390595 RepID=UPI003D022259
MSHIHPSFFAGAEKPENPQPAHRGFLLRLRAYLCDRRGIGGVEFAIIAPILIAAYFTCFELTVGFSFGKRATRAAGTVGDLVAQQSSVNKAFLATMTNAAKSIFAPYDVDGLTTSANNPLNIKITGIQIDDAGVAKTLWSWQRTGGVPYAVNSLVTVPKEMRIKDTFLVRTELTASYPLMLFLPTNFSSQNRAIPMNREIFYQQRTGDKVSCTDC